MSKFKLTDEQQAIRDAFVADKSIGIMATAGSGKTSMLLRLSEEFSGQALAIAFNKSIAGELSTKFPSHFKVSTLHALGFAAIRNRFKRINVENRATKAFIMTWMNDNNNYGFINDKFAAAKALEEMTNIAKMRGIDSWRGIVPFMQETPSRQLIDIFPDLYASMIDNARNQPVENVTFLDMIWLPTVREDMPLKKYPLVLLDEAQDANHLMQQLTINSIADGGRAVIVGDRFQSIYAFMGADPQAITRFMSLPGMNEMPMDTSFRCSHSVVRAANKYNPAMRAFASNQEGVVRKGSILEAQDGDFILCRNNAPLFKAYFELLSRGKKVFLKDMDLKKKLVNNLKKYHGQSYSQMIALEQDNLQRIYWKLAETITDHEDIVEHPAYQKVAEFINFCDVLHTSVADAGDPASMIKALDRIFSSNGAGISLLTMHGSKGLESERVFIIRFDLVGKHKSSDKTQENNLAFVAITRAKNELVFDDDFDQE